MRTLRTLWIMVAAVAIVACQKDDAVNEKRVEQEVVFGISDAMNLKSDWNFECDDELVPRVAEVMIDGVTYYPEVFYLGGKLYTQAIKLDVDISGGANKQTYTLEKFLLWTAHPVLDPGNAEIVKAAPLKGSEFADFVAEALEFTFDVYAFDKKEVEIEVLCFNPAEIDGFGFTWFYIGEIVVREMCFFGDLCIKSPSDYAQSLYSEVLDLENYPFDLPAIFKIKVYRNGAFFKTFSNVKENEDGTKELVAPLCVRYPDNVRKPDLFTFELWVYVAVGSGFDYVLFNTWSVTDDQQIPTDHNGVVDFVIGNCNYQPGDFTLVLPPYQNLPEQANATFVQNYADGGYWTLTINSLDGDASANYFDFPDAGLTVLGWCGDAEAFITPGTANFYIYSSMNNAGWPASTPVSLSDLAKVNWLFNNLSTFGYPALTNMFVEPSDLNISVQQAQDLQHAIWLILGQPLPAGEGPASAEAQAMAAAAAGKGGFLPLPGGYAAVLMMKDNDPAQFQLIFTIVDP